MKMITRSHFYDWTGLLVALSATLVSCQASEPLASPQPSVADRAAMPDGKTAADTSSAAESSGGEKEAIAPPSSAPSSPSSVSSDSTPDRSEAIFQGGGFTVTITGLGSNAAYRGCNAQQECLDIPQAAHYSQSTYTWENGDYTYVMTPIQQQASDGSYQLQVFDPADTPVVNVTLTPVAGHLNLAPAVLNTFFQAAPTLGVCADGFTPETAQQFSSAYRVNSDDAIVEVQCTLGAYQGNYEYWFYQTTESSVQWTRLSFKGYVVDDTGVQSTTQTEELWGLPTYDPATETLTIFSKYRGVGDCGAYSQYQWEGDRFTLMLYRAKEECDGNYVDPVNYPQIYPPT